MGLRHAWLALSLLGLSCSSFALHEPARPSSPEPPTQTPKSAPEAIPVGYQESITESNKLREAISCLEGGEVEPACQLLAEYLRTYPGHVLVRSRFAELLLRLRRIEEARAEFQRVLDDAIDESPAMASTLIHSHRRLMEIAEADQDAYGEHLHRGIGLFLLGRERLRITDAGEELPAEALLCKAAAELTLAGQERKEEARPPWYLHRVWTQLGQLPAARRCLHQALEAAPFASLTAHEQRGICLAEQRLLAEPRRR
jgi:tetratricopeptide (TPR) repeat protein